jgi:hypothetical protein
MVRFFKVTIPTLPQGSVRSTFKTEPLPLNRSLVLDAKEGRSQPLLGELNRIGGRDMPWRREPSFAECACNGALPTGAKDQIAGADMSAPAIHIRTST